MRSQKNNIPAIFLLGFVLTLHTALPVYIYSSFLSEIVSEQFVGLVYAISAFVTLAAINFLPRLLRRFGNFRLTSAVLAAELLTLICLLILKTPLLVIPAFVLNFTFVGLLGLNLDIFLEAFSTDNKTGNLRGSFLTIINTAWLITPAATGFFVTNNNYGKLITVAIVLAVPAFAVLKSKLKNFRDPVYHDFPITKTIREVSQDKNLRAIFVVSFLLQFFYAWMIIYTPLYLHNHLGLSWQDIGIIFTVMLLPFIIFERPAGTAADRKFGEQEILMAGFGILALSTAAVGIYSGQSIAIWAALLFLTRVGASLIEVMGDTYFFKKVNAGRANVISLFRATRPLALIAAPAAATIILTVIPLQSIFFVLATLLLLGLAAGAKLKDTK